MSYIIRHIHNVLYVNDKGLLTWPAGQGSLCPIHRQAPGCISPQIPTDRIHEVEIPTGLPLVFNVKKKCIQVLDDGLDTDSLDPLAR